MSINFEPRGVRKVNERIVAEGRALIITDKSESEHAAQWEDIPAGSLYIGPNNGYFYIKKDTSEEWELVSLAHNVSIWKLLEYPHGGLTLEEMEENAELFKIAIQEIEKVISDSVSNWANFDHIAIYQKLQFIRLKIADILEMLYPGSSEFFLEMDAYQAAQGFDVLNTGTYMLVEAISAIPSGTIKILEFKLKRLRDGSPESLTYQKMHISEQVVTVGMIAEEVRAVSLAIGSSVDTSKISEEEIMGLRDGKAIMNINEVVNELILEGSDKNTLVPVPEKEWTPEELYYSDSPLAIEQREKVEKKDLEERIKRLEETIHAMSILLKDK